MMMYNHIQACAGRQCRQGYLQSILQSEVCCYCLFFMPNFSVINIFFFYKIKKYLIDDFAGSLSRQSVFSNVLIVSIAVSSIDDNGDSCCRGNRCYYIVQCFPTFFVIATHKFALFCIRDPPLKKIQVQVCYNIVILINIFILINVII